MGLVEPVRVGLVSLVGLDSICYGGSGRLFGSVKSVKSIRSVRSVRLGYSVG